MEKILTLICEKLNFDPRFRRCPPEVRERVCFPNDMKDGKIDGVRVLVLVAFKKPDSSDWGLSKGGIEHLLNQKRQGRIDHGFVALAESGAKIASVRLAEEVWDGLKDVPPMAGKYGEYWWIDVHFRALNSTVDDDRPY